MKPVLEIKNLTKTFVTEGKSDFTAVDHVSFQLYPGETLGIVGESGSGKSTLARIISRLIDATEGSIFLDEQDVTEIKGKKLRTYYKDIKMVFQSPVTSFDPRRTLGDVIGEILRNQGLSKKEAKKEALYLLQQCGLSSEFYERYPHEVSGGQCQRAAIARALAVDPEILICDEATSALDPNTTKSILELIKQINRDLGITVIVITHEMAVIEAICDRVAIIDHSQIAEYGRVSEIFSEPKSKIGRQLILGDAVENVRFDKSRKIRITFDGRSYMEPVLANMILASKVPVNILYASTKDIGGTAYGQMIIQLPEDETDAARALHYLKSVQVPYEEVNGNVI